MSCLRSLALACAIAALLPLSAALAGSSGEIGRECGPSSRTWVASPSVVDARLVCAGVEAAAGFLSSHGFTVPAIRVNVVAAMPDGIPDSALGAFSRSRNEIFILGFSALSVRNLEYRVFNIPVDEAVYTAIVAHEAAHAIAIRNFRVPPTLLAQEYIAFVTFFHALEKKRREDLLWHYDYDEDWMQYPAIMYLADQVGFGAHAFRHFQRPGNGSLVFRQILDGNILSVDE